MDSAIVALNPQLRIPPNNQLLRATPAPRQSAQVPQVAQVAQHFAAGGAPPGPSSAGSE